MRTPQQLSPESWQAILDRQGHEDCPGVSRQERVQVAPANAERGELQAWIWTPSDPKQRSGADLVAFHGGGYCVGDPSGCGAIAKTLALALGVTTISLSYRLGTIKKPVFPGILTNAA